MGLFWICFGLYGIIAIFAQLPIWMDDVTKIRWQRAAYNYKEYPSPNTKKKLAEAAALYIKKRRLSYYWWAWPIMLPISLVKILWKLPRMAYRYFKDGKSAYAQARMHMNGEIK